MGAQLGLFSTETNFGFVVGPGLNHQSYTFGGRRFDQGNVAVGVSASENRLTIADPGPQGLGFTIAPSDRQLNFGT